jgi:hypothetical protein
MSEELKAQVMDVMQKSSQRGKQKLYVTEMAKRVEGASHREVKKAVSELIAEGKLAYWSSGSTTYLMLKEDFDNLHLE